MDYKAIIFFSLFSVSLNAQKAVQDKAKHGQIKRDVSIEWGDWQPKSKKILGVQSNPNYEMIWGWTAPAFGGNKKKNKEYKAGEDKRGYSTNAKANFNRQYASDVLTASYTKEINERMQLLGNYAQEEYLSSSANLAEATPLYLLYFKKRLSPIKKWTKEQSLKEIIADEKTFQNLYNKGYIDAWDNSILTLKDRLDGAGNEFLDIGKRLILFHEIFVEYRNEISRIKDLVTRNKFTSKQSVKLNIDKPNTTIPQFSDDWNIRDKEIVRINIIKAE